MHQRNEVAIAVLTSLMALGLCSFQYGDKYALNNMPFAEVQPLVFDLKKAQNLAKQGNIELYAGQAVSGQTIRLRGELADGNCYLGGQRHAYDHAFCAKLCVAAGSPLVFIPDQPGQLYIVLGAQNGVRLSKSVLDSIGVPGVVVKGRAFDADGLKALAIEALEP